MERTALLLEAFAIPAIIGGMGLERFSTVLNRWGISLQPDL
jgi:hypothetical protein